MQNVMQALYLTRNARGLPASARRYSLSELQENTVKMQIVFRGEGAPELPAGLNLLHESHLGRVFTIIFRGNTQQITERLAALDPVYMEAVPLTLEEIFIYELGGADYAVRDIVL